MVHNLGQLSQIFPVSFLDGCLQLFEISIRPREGDNGLDISNIRIVSKSDGKGCSYNLGRHSAASVTFVEARRGERLLGFLHGGLYITGRCVCKHLSLN